VSAALLMQSLYRELWSTTCKQDLDRSLVVEVVIKDSFVAESIGLFAASCPCWTNLID
jgi:hypothetical protein